MFESHLTHHFFRLWGVEEGATGINVDTILLGNSQNEFDHKLGDVTGVTGCRFFLIEFKRDRDGIAAEVGSHGKPHRRNLYRHLRVDQHCAQLSFAGHYAAYPDDTNRLAFEPYAHAAAPLLASESNPASQEHFTPSEWHVLDFPRPFLPFQEFYDGMTASDSALSDQRPGFASGFGLPRGQFREYIDCMYAHLQVETDSAGNAVLGTFNPKKNEFTAFGGSIEDLVKKMHAAFKRLSASMQPPPSPYGRVTP